MTNEEIEIRITRLETSLAATQSLLHCVLPATDPSQAHVVLDQFRQWCEDTEAQYFQDYGPSHLVDVQMEELANRYEAAKGALELIAQWQQKKVS